MRDSNDDYDEDYNSLVVMRESDIFRWRAAPANLRTRRQLRAAGLCPGRQAPAGLLLREGRRRVLWAYLYDLERATPKRAATPAQLAALAAGNRARQIAAAERRGISRAELTESIDPWGEGTSPAPTNIQA